MRDVADPYGRLSRFFLFLLSPDFREEHTAMRQIERLGYDARDVRHIVLTHLDFASRSSGIRSGAVRRACASTSG